MHVCNFCSTFAQNLKKNEQKITYRTCGWTPDADSEIKLYHSLNDDIVAPENSQMMYQWLVSKGVQNAVLDTSSLTGTHLGSAAYFLLNVITYDLSNW